MAEVELPDVEELEEHRGKTFTRRAALTTAIFAVLLAITSLGGSNASKELLLSQQQASDQWAFYQSKVIREHLYRTDAQRLAADIAAGAAVDPAGKAAYEKLLEQFQEESARNGKEKKQIEEDAKRLEETRNEAAARDPYFDYAEVLLQIAIVLASIAILAVSPAIYAMALVVAACGTLFMLNGYLLVVRLPFLH
jgi:hypothetical protein